MQPEPERPDTPPVLILLYEAAARWAASRQGLPASCPWKRCRASGGCRLSLDLATGAARAGCGPPDATIARAADHIAFVASVMNDDLAGKARFRREPETLEGHSAGSWPPSRRARRRSAQRLVEQERRFEAWRRGEEDAALAGYSEDGPP